MTKEEIKAIIAQKIEGQGTNLDAASVLPTILNWIIDNMGGDNPLADSIIDVGEVRGDQINEISDELGNKYLKKGFFLKVAVPIFRERAIILLTNKQSLMLSKTF